MLADVTGLLLRRYPEHRDLHARLSSFLDEHLPPAVAPDWLDLRRRAAHEGLTALGAETSPASGHVAQGVAALLAGQRDCDARDMFGVGHAAMVLRHGDPALAASVRSSVLDDGVLVGAAVSEPQAGSDLHGLSTVAITHDTHLLLNGTKGLISRVREAHGFIVFCKALESPDDGRCLRGVPLTALWLPRDARGLRFRASSPMGLQGSSFGYLDLSDVPVRREWILGSPGSGRTVFDAHFAVWRPLMALVCLGAAAASVEESAIRSARRRVGTVSLAQLPAVATRLGQAAAEITAAIVWCFSLLDELDKGIIDQAGSAAVKALATQSAYRAVDLALQLHGSEGYTDHTPLEKRLRDIRGLCIADGPNDALFSATAHALLQHTPPAQQTDPTASTRSTPS